MSCIESDFAGSLRAAMEERGVTVHGLVDLCGGAFSARTIFRWRGGQSVPGIEALPLLTRALDVTADRLLGLDSPHPS